MRLVLLALIAGVAGSAAAAAPHVRRLSDSDLLRYASSSFDARKMMGQRQIVGLHRGIRVVADFPCGDVCPQYTRRVIHYDLPLGDCARRGGIVRTEMVVRGIGLAGMDVCKPAILAKSRGKG